MTSENNECDAQRCRTPLNAEEWCYIVRKPNGKPEAVHTRCLIEKVPDFDSTVEAPENHENATGRNGIESK